MGHDHEFEMKLITEIDSLFDEYVKRNEKKRWTPLDKAKDLLSLLAHLLLVLLLLHLLLLLLHLLLLMKLLKLWPTITMLVIESHTQNWDSDSGMIANGKWNCIHYFLFLLYSCRMFRGCNVATNLYMYSKI